MGGAAAERSEGTLDEVERDAFMRRNEWDLAIYAHKFGGRTAFSNVYITESIFSRRPSRVYSSDRFAGTPEFCQQAVWQLRQLLF
jgi:hypothetical protein